MYIRGSKCIIVWPYAKVWNEVAYISMALESMSWNVVANRAYAYICSKYYLSSFREECNDVSQYID